MKISLKNLEKIIELCTKKEIDMIIYIGQFQDSYGVVRGIDYKDVISNVGICKSTFYKLLYSLEEKGIIKINYINEHGYWEIKFVDNEFKDSSDYKNGYLKLNYHTLHSDEFKAMTKGEKVLTIHILRLTDFKKGLVKLTLERIARLTGKTMRSVLKFINTLSKVFRVIKNGNLFMVDCRSVGFATQSGSEANTFIKHHINYRLKKAKCQVTNDVMNDVCIVLKQYKKAENTSFIFTLVDDMVKRFGTLMPAYMNKLLNPNRQFM